MCSNQKNHIHDSITSKNIQLCDKVTQTLLIGLLTYGRRNYVSFKTETTSKATFDKDLIVSIV